MKKALPFFAAVIMILTAGCEKQIKNTAPPPPPSSFTADLSVKYCGTELKANITQQSFDEFEVKIITPEILSDLTINYSNGECMAKYEGLEFNTDASRFPQAEFGSLLTNALTAVSQNIDIQKTFESGIWTYKGLLERGEFSITQNAENGDWICFTVQAADLTVSFSNLTRK